MAILWDICITSLGGVGLLFALQLYSLGAVKEAWFIFAVSFLAGYYIISERFDHDKECKVDDS